MPESVRAIRQRYQYVPGGFRHHKILTDAIKERQARAEEAAIKEEKLVRQNCRNELLLETARENAKQLLKGQRKKRKQQQQQQQQQATATDSSTHSPLTVISESQHGHVPHRPVTPIAAQRQQLSHRTTSLPTSPTGMVQDELAAGSSSPRAPVLSLRDLLPSDGAARDTTLSATPTRIEERSRQHFLLNDDARRALLAQESTRRQQVGLC
jgi:hypothetical protein